MADATDLKSVDRKVVWVRIPPSAPIISIIYKDSSFSLNSHNGVNSVARLILVEIIEEDRVAM
jgi:hypothetical protein